MSYLAVLDYGIGNLRSAQKALEQVGADARLTADHDEIAGAAGVVLPGVGNFGRCMEALDDSGLAPVALAAAADAAAGRGRAFLGICVGMQMLYTGSVESPGVAGLGVLTGEVQRIPEGVKHPQMQWNRLVVRRESSLFGGLPPAPWMYFVHTYAAEDTSDVIATCDYGGDVVAAVERGSLFACQFHPEKSGTSGLRLLANFVSLAGLTPDLPDIPAT